MLEGLSSAETGALLGLGDADAASDPDPEREYADVLLAVLTTPGAADAPNGVAPASVAAVAVSSWCGVPNRLSDEHVDWDIIRIAADACEKSRTADEVHRVGDIASDHRGERAPVCTTRAGQILRQRRSAVSMDATTWIGSASFFRMLEVVMPRPAAPPFDVWPYASRVDLALFVHRVQGLVPGLYILVREPRRRDELRSAMRVDFAWTRPEACPETLPLYLLAELDCRGMAAQVSCIQAIAGDGAFSLGMIAEFEAPMRQFGAWYYPRLFWETGLIGQALYLEAEAAGVRATGIGCYFDDAMHDVLGLRGRAFQSLYHFTVGGAVDDPRITGLPAYGAERRTMRGWV
jgi:nitroreductase